MRFNILFVVGISILGLSSCIKDEALNKEADIESFTLEQDSVIIDSRVENDRVQLEVKDGTDYKNLTPVIKLSPGAKISPAPSGPMDFTKDVIFTVTSEDNQYYKDYVVSIIPRIKTSYNFEEWTMAGGLWKYPALKDISWSSANQGIMLAKVGKVAYYPTRDTILSVLPNKGVTTNHAAVLETLPGGKFFGNYVPIFAGSLFRGVFRLNMADFVQSAKFGQIHPKESGKPVEFTGYYKYTPGKYFTDEDGDTIANRIDEFSIYAVLYRVTKDDAGKSEFLDGGNIQTSDKVMGIAELTDRSAKAEFTKFSIPFVYRMDKAIDYDKFDYKLAVVFSSSKEGDFYRGAIGSMLIVDDVEVVCEVYKE